MPIKTNNTNTSVYYGSTKVNKVMYGSAVVADYTSSSGGGSGTFEDFTFPSYCQMTVTPTWSDYLFRESMIDNMYLIIGAEIDGTWYNGDELLSVDNSPSTCELFPYQNTPIISEIVIDYDNLWSVRGYKNHGSTDIITIEGLGIKSYSNNVEYIKVFNEETGDFEELSCGNKSTFYNSMNGYYYLVTYDWSGNIGANYTGRAISIKCGYADGTGYDYLNSEETISHYIEFNSYYLDSSNMYGVSASNEVSGFQVSEGQTYDVKLYYATGYPYKEFIRCSWLTGTFVIANNITKMESPRDLFHDSKVTELYVPANFNFENCSVGFTNTEPTLEKLYSNSNKYLWALNYKENFTSLKTITIGKDVTTFAMEFGGYTALKELIVEPTTPPDMYSGAFDSNILEAVYVPDESVNTYKADTNWSKVASIIKPISERPNT